MPATAKMKYKPITPKPQAKHYFIIKLNKPITKVEIWLKHVSSLHHIIEAGSATIKSFSKKFCWP